jgi:hypothetical protein
VEDWRKSGQSGVQPGATSLVFHRGVGSGHGVGFGDAAPLQAQSIDAPPLPARVFRAGRGGSGAKRVSVRQYGKCFFLKSLLHLTEFKINCNSADRKSGKDLAERAEFWVRRFLRHRSGKGETGGVRLQVPMLRIVPM